MAAKHGPPRIPGQLHRGVEQVVLRGIADFLRWGKLKVGAGGVAQPSRNRRGASRKQPLIQSFGVRRRVPRPLDREEERDPFFFGSGPIGCAQD